MVNVDVPKETHEKITELVDKYDHPATNKWVVRKAVDQLYKEEKEDGA